MEKQLKLYVWPEYCPDFNDGLAFALAENEEKARDAVTKAKGFDPYEWGPVYEYSIETPIAFERSGGS
jgi:hypothetical protein